MDADARREAARLLLQWSNLERAGGFEREQPHHQAAHAAARQRLLEQTHTFLHELAGALAAPPAAGASS